jgi:hypothetical protein
MRNLHIQLGNDKNAAYLNWMEKAFSDVSLKCNCSAPLTREVTNFKNGYHIKKSYTVLHSTKTDTLTAMQRAFCTQLYMKPHQSVDFCGPLCTQSRTQPAVTTQFSLCPSFLTDQ